jgi:hypothetical protein
MRRTDVIRRISYDCVTNGNAEGTNSVFVRGKGLRVYTEPNKKGRVPVETYHKP